MKGYHVDKKLGLFIIASDSRTEGLQHNVKNVLKVELQNRTRYLQSGDLFLIVFKVKRPSLRNSNFDAFSHFMNIRDPKRSLLGEGNVQK